MPDVSYDVFLPEVLIEIPAVSHPVAINAIRNAAIEFCARSGAYRRDLDPISLVADQDIYTPTALTNTVVHGVVKIWSVTTGLGLSRATAGDLDRDVPGWRASGAKSQIPNWWHMEDERRVRVALKPSENRTNELHVIATLKPTRASTVIDSVFGEDYQPAIVCGALSGLFGMADERWTNMDRARVKRMEFDRAVTATRVQIEKGRTRAPTVMRPPVFGGGH